MINNWQSSGGILKIYHLPSITEEVQIIKTYHGMHATCEQLTVGGESSMKLEASKKVLLAHVAQGAAKLHDDKFQYSQLLNKNRIFLDF